MDPVPAFPRLESRIPLNMPTSIHAKTREGMGAGRYLTTELLLGDAGDHPDLPRLDLYQGVGGLSGKHPHRRRLQERAAKGGEAPPERGGHLVGAVHHRSGGDLGKEEPREEEACGLGLERRRNCGGFERKIDTFVLGRLAQSK
jgi:hypothetical protein